MTDVLRIMKYHNMRTNLFNGMEKFQAMYDELSPCEKKQFVENNRELFSEMCKEYRGQHADWDRFPLEAFCEELQTRYFEEIIDAIGDDHAVKDWLEKQIME